jgi:hypothetical protein
MIITPDVSVPEKTEKVITLMSNKRKGVSFSIVDDTVLVVVKVRALVVVSVSGSVALRVPIKKPASSLLAIVTKPSVSVSALI